MATHASSSEPREFPGSAKIRFAAFHEGWKLFAGNPWPWVAALLIYYVLTTLWLLLTPETNATASPFGGFGGVPTGAPAGGTLSDVAWRALLRFIEYSFRAGLLLMALSHARRGETRLELMRGVLPYVPALTVQAAVLFIIDELVCALTPGVLAGQFAFAFIVEALTLFAVPLVLDDRAGPVRALVRSARATGRSLLKAVVFIAASIPLVFLPVVGMPVEMLATAILYVRWVDAGQTAQSESSEMSGCALAGCFGCSGAAVVVGALVSLPFVFGGIPSGALPPVTSVSALPDGSILAETATVRGTRSLVLIGQAHKDRTPLKIRLESRARIAVSPDGNTLAVGSGEEIGLFSLQDARRYRSLKVPDRPESVSFSADSRRVACVHPLGFNVWDVTTGKALASSDADVGWPAGSALSGDLGYAAISRTRGWMRGDLHVYHVRSGRQTGSAALPFLPGGGIAVSPDGRTVACGLEEGSAVLATVPTGAVRQLKGLVGSAAGAAFAPDGTRVAVGFRRGVTGIWSVPNGSLVRKIENRRGESLQAIAISPDGRKLVQGISNSRHRWSLLFGRNTGLVRVWDLHTGRLLRDIL